MKQDTADILKIIGSLFGGVALLLFFVWVFVVGFAFMCGQFIYWMDYFMG